MFIKLISIGFIGLLMTSCTGVEKSPRETSLSPEIPLSGSLSGDTLGRELSPSIPASPTLSGKKIEITNTHILPDRTDPNPLLINDLVSNRLFLMNKTGEVLYEWPLSVRKLGNDATLLPTGSLIASVRSQDSKIILGGYGGVVEYIGKDGESLWKYKLSEAKSISHHDVELLPNGNILALIWDKISKEDSKKYGYKMEVDIFAERIVEINPETDTIVWEWKSMDHIIQDVDPKLPNYGDVARRPERIDINYAQSQSGMIMHANGLAYDPTNKLIYLSLYSMSEIWVIDHSTTTAEAQGSKGGDFNRGGDLVYRFGNPSTYRGKGERLFYSNHHPSFTNSGTFLIYSNGIGATPEQSTVYELRLPMELSKKQSTLKEPEIIWSYTNPEIYFDKVGGVVRLENGNTLITEGDGVLWEITPEKEIAWKYSMKPAMFWRTYSYSLDSPAIKALELGATGSTEIK